MTVTKAHTLYGVVFNATVLGGITAQNISTGTTVRGEGRSGEPYSRINHLVGQKPGATFTSEDIAAALAVCGPAGVDIDGLAAGLILYAQAFADGGTRASGANHRSYTIYDGIVAPQQLRCTHQGDASIDYAALATYDGTHSPLVEADTVSLPAGLTDNARFTLGPITIGGVTLAEYRDLTIDFGIMVRSEGAESDIWDTFSYIVTYQPTITLRGIDVEWLKSTNIPLAGKAAAHADTAIYLRKRSDGGTFVADATAEHIQLTAAGLAWIPTPMDASGLDPAECTLMLRTKYDGTNLPIVVDTTSALP